MDRYSVDYFRFNPIFDFFLGILVYFDYKAQQIKKFLKLSF